MKQFKRGDLVTDEAGRQYRFISYWRDWPGGHLYTLRNACDVQALDGATGPYGYPYVAKSADDLRHVEEVSTDIH